MKKILLVLLALILTLTVSTVLADSDTVTVKVELSYQYSMARDMITAINNFRTGADGEEHLHQAVHGGGGDPQHPGRGGQAPDRERYGQ